MSFPAAQAFRRTRAPLRPTWTCWEVTISSPATQTYDSPAFVKASLSVAFVSGFSRLESAPQPKSARTRFRYPCAVFACRV